jgi:alkylation response protein AidB-like acyl-CoA dehydrogenase
LSEQALSEQALSEQALSEQALSEGAVLDAVRAIGPQLAAKSDDIEANRTLPADVVELIKPTGAFRAWVPAALNGPEASPWEGVQTIEEASFHDMASGWCIAIAATSSLMSSYLPAEHAHALFSDPNSIAGGFAAPLGRARQVDGGLRISGTWQWGSGTQHCTTVGGGCLVVDDAGKPTRRADGLAVPFAFFDVTDVEFLDTWYTSGLAGTGSTDYRVSDAFVPEGRWVQVGFDPPVLDNALTGFSFYGLLALSIAATAVGSARRSIAELITLAQDKRPQGSSKPLRERQTVQGDVALAEAQLRSSWGFVESTMDMAWQTILAGDPCSDDQKRLLRLAATHATQTASDVVDLIYKAAGGAAVYRTSQIQRCFRDINVATQHAMVAPRTYEVAGRMSLGLETDTRQL